MNLRTRIQQWRQSLPSWMPGSSRVDENGVEIHISLQSSQPPNRREAAYRRFVQEQHKRRLLEFSRMQRWHRRREKWHMRVFRMTPAVFVTLGSVILANAVWPILSYMLFVSPDLQVQELVSPLPDIAILRQTQTIQQVHASAPETISPKIIRDNLDFTNLNNWFPQGGEQTASLSHSNKAEDGENQKEIVYTLNIPSLDIEDAEIRIGGTDLDQSLIQYPGTADPGELGAPVIFGHSVLRQFYNPSLKNPRRYMSIFSKIMTMQAGEKIYLEYDGITYTYSVLKKVEVKPEDTYILEQEYSARQLKLVTCVPEGTYLRRGIVLAQLEEIQ